MKNLISLVAAAALVLPGISVAAEVGNPKVLMVLSSYGEQDAEGKLVKPGYEFDEMSKSYLVFAASGAQVTFASPNGGKLVTDKYDASKPYNEKFLANQDAVAALESTRKLSDIRSADYDAVYVVGGKGPMFDLAKDQNVKRIIQEVYEDDGIVGAVCHGPAALLDVKLGDGSHLVDGKRISAFTNEEESVFTKAWTMPFQLEDKLVEQGAVFRQDGLMLNQVSIDGRVITGQNPFSTADTARAVVKALGLENDGSLEFRDDRTIMLVERFFADRVAAMQDFTAHMDRYDPMLLAMFGVYQARYANTQAELDVALTLMQATQETIKHPMLDVAIAKGFLAKNDSRQARVVLTASNQKFPENEEISGLLESLTD
ncbi:type 1 glutamine amidotransferase domain-containing protein [Biformimicrobium ophioploci]|nr:type 1 glutamine amidotransferase domain-containing protein [Microbulbifer sp. NKW57]